MKLGYIPKTEAERMKSQLIIDIHNIEEKLHIKNIQITERRRKTYAWITLSPETAHLSCRMMS